MSYWIYLEDEHGKTLTSERTIQEGGTYVLGGTNECSLNVTYNYSAQYCLFGGEIRREDGCVIPVSEFSLRNLNGEKAKDVAPLLEGIARMLGTRRDPDYWKPTLGNAGFALSILLGWAKEHPEGRFRVS